MPVPDGTTRWITDKFGTYEMTCVDAIYVRYKHHDSSPDKRYSTLVIPKSDGVKLISGEYDVKEIEVVGYIKETDYATLNDKIDEMKERLAEENGILEIGIGDDRARRYYCTPEKPIEIEDDFGNIIGQEWRVVFICYDPFGYGTTTYTGSSSGCAEGIDDSIYIRGTAEAVPDITITPRYETATVVELENTTTNERLIMEGSFEANNPITIDSLNLSITYESEAVSNTGVFPTWPPGWNNYTVGLPNATAGCVDINFSYLPRYL